MYCCEIIPISCTIFDDEKLNNVIYVEKEVWPKVVLKRLSMSLTHPYQCTRCKEWFHKIHEATTHYLSSHQNSNDLPEKEIPENETKIKVEKYGDQIKKEIKIEIKEEIKFETEVQRGHSREQSHRNWSLLAISAHRGLSISTL